MDVSFSRTLRLALLVVPFVIAALFVLPNPVGALVQGEFNDAADFEVFYEGAELFGDERYAELYDPQRFPTVIERSDPNLWYAYAPFYARAWQPLTALSIDAAWVLWTLLSIALVGAAVVIAGRSWSLGAILLATASFPAAMNLQLGQNAAIAALIFAVSFALLRADRMVAAGVVFGLLVFKPQLAVGVGVWWLVDRRYRRAAWAALATSGAIVGLSLLIDGSAWSLYRSALSDLAAFRGQHLQMSIAGFVDLLLPGWSAARTAGVVLGIVVLAGFGWWARLHRDPVVAFAVAAGTTLLAAPYVLMYDYLILLAPIVVLIAARDVSRLWLPAVVLSWVVVFSALLTDGMTDALGFGVQLAPVALAWAVLAVARTGGRQAA